MRFALKVRPQMGMSYRRILELAQAAEASGFEAFVRSDHWRSMDGQEMPATDAWTTLAGLARETRMIRLGTLVSPITLRGPYELAKIVATVDEMSEGRMELGIGAGWLEREHEPLGIPLPPLGERFGRLEEQLAIVTGLWTRPTLTFDGRWYTLREAALEPKPVQRPTPPIVLGGKGRPRGAALAARWATEYNFDAMPSDAVAAAVPGLLAACEAIGRDPATLVVSAATGRPSRDDAAGRIAAFEAAGVARLYLDAYDGTLDTREIEWLGREIVARRA
jgi:F420-dependent oxidoreductase-like protein